MSRHSRYFTTAVAGFFFAALPGARVAQASDWMVEYHALSLGPQHEYMSLELGGFYGAFKVGF